MEINEQRTLKQKVDDALNVAEDVIGIIASPSTLVLSVLTNSTGLTHGFNGHVSNPQEQKIKTLQQEEAAQSNSLSAAVLLYTRNHGHAPHDFSELTQAINEYNLQLQEKAAKEAPKYLYPYRYP